MKCRFSHADYQPETEEWSCPNCGEREVFKILDVSPYHESDCDLLHDSDQVMCAICASEYTGEELSEILYQKSQMAPFKAMVDFFLRESESGPTTRQIAEQLAKKLSEANDA